jgi:hypothetical protein
LFFFENRWWEDSQVSFGMFFPSGFALHDCW